MTHSTFIMLKPDARDNNLEQTILKELEEKGCIIKRQARVLVDKELILTHYKEVIEQVDIKDFPHRILKEYEHKEVLVAEVVHPQQEVVSFVREMIGATEPIKANAHTIRGKYSNDSYAKSMAEERLVRNLIHASDSIETAQKEIQLWFKD